jgi:hypothetical protein
MDMLRKRGLLIEIDNILVDGDQLILRTFQCDTNYCVRCTGAGAAREYKGSCCTDLQVDITGEEKDRLIDMANQARLKLPLKRNDPLTKVIDGILADKVTETNAEHEMMFRHKENGACAMSWIDSAGQLRCSINTLCERLGLDLRHYKPDPCFLFPLHYAQIGRDRFILTVLSEETRYWIEQHQAVTKLRCLRSPQRGSPPAYQFLRGEIEYLLSKRFFEELERRAEPILEAFLARSQNGADEDDEIPDDEE